MNKIILIIIISLTLFYWFKISKEPLPYFQIIFFDVGQGDSTLIITPERKTILIDGGPDQKVLKELGRYLPFWNREINLLIITHAHDDHFIGLIEVLRRYKVEKILVDLSQKGNNVWLEVKSMIEKSSLFVVNPRRGMVFNFDNNCFLKILSSHDKIRKDENDYSIVSKFSCLGRSVMLAGDASELIERDLLGQDLNLKSDIFKLSHHGSQTANSEEFIFEISPHLAVVSAGFNNKFKHPNVNILERLEKMSVDIYQTMLIGSINFLANNNEIILKK